MRLSEGLIKLPSVANDLRRLLLRWYFAYVEGVLPAKFTGSDLVEATRILQTAKSRYGVTLTKQDITIAKNRGFRVKSFSVEEMVYGKRLDLRGRLKVVFSRSKLGGLGEYIDEDHAFIQLSPYNLHMTGPSLSTLSSLRASLAKVDQLLGLLEHELAHLVQHKAMHQAQIHTRPGYAEESDDYYLSQVEFDPSIKSALGKVKTLMAKYKSMPGYSERELVDAFVLAGDPPAWMSPNDISAFFDALYNRAPARWKKAVKLFMHELSVS